LTPVSSSWSAARATRCGTVSILTPCSTNRTQDALVSLHRWSMLVGSSLSAGRSPLTSSLRRCPLTRKRFTGSNPVSPTANRAAGPEGRGRGTPPTAGYRSCRPARSTRLWRSLAFEIIDAVQEPSSVIPEAGTCPDGRTVSWLRFVPLAMITSTASPGQVSSAECT
jgi:hypothetical protein